MNLIVAVDEKWGIGRDNGLLASVPGDMQYFKEHTMDKVVVMGRKTLESMPKKRGLPKRINYVLTTQQDYEAERCIIVHTEDELFEAIGQYDPDDVFLIGGASMYNRYYKLCDKLYITKMYADLNADAFIVNIDEDENYEIVSESELHEDNGIQYRFYVYERKNPAE